MAKKDRQEDRQNQVEANPKSLKKPEVIKFKMNEKIIGMDDRLKSIYRIKN